MSAVIRIMLVVSHLGCRVSNWTTERRLMLNLCGCCIGINKCHVRQHIQLKQPCLSPDNRMMISHILDKIDELTWKHARCQEPQKEVLLDTIYTNIGDWYNASFTAPVLGKSDHLSVIMQPACHSQAGGQTVVTVCTATVFEELHNINWTALYGLDLYEGMITMFYWNTG